MARRPVWAEIDLGCVRDNTRWMTALIAPAQLCAVVKAFGYGHGPVRVAEAALAGGATWLAVATVEEGVQLRQAGVTEPTLLLSEPVASAMPDVIAWNLVPTLYTAAGVEAAARAVSGYGAGVLPVHVKIDTGMHRVGATPTSAMDLARAVVADPGLELDGLMTHLAVADEPLDPYTPMQLTRFRETADKLAAEGIAPRLLHAANSAAAIAFPSSRLDLVRCGVALYGLAPSLELAAQCPELRPAMSVKARVSYVKEVDAGERISYGLRYEFGKRSVVATVPMGYADGVPRRLAERGGEVLIGGRRHPIAGSVTMDQITVDCGDAPVEPGDEVVLLGRQGDAEITAWEWAGRLDTIAYEVVCGISSRVPRATICPPVLTDIGGVRVGHWTDAVARTGCTVVLLPAGTVASGEVRGGAPGTREWELLGPTRLVQRVDAVVLSGGSAFGLAACDGVVRWCEERGLGLPTPAGPVPLVVGCVLYDLGVGDPRVRPGPDQGYAACVAATAGRFETGAVGAGTGATVGNWRGPGKAWAGGIGTATERGPGGLLVAALVACNAWGEPRPAAPPTTVGPPDFLTNTTIGVIVTNAMLDKGSCLLVAQSGHDGLARALEPVHTSFDGDALVAASTGVVAPEDGPLGVETVRILAAKAVENAVAAATG